MDIKLGVMCKTGRQPLPCQAMQIIDKFALVTPSARAVKQYVITCDPGVHITATSPGATWGKNNLKSGWDVEANVPKNTWKPLPMACLRVVFWDSVGLGCKSLV